jgi:hypothetical protein
MQEIIIGVDPGKMGGIVALFKNSDDLTMLPMPISGKEIDIIKIRDFLISLKMKGRISKVIVEDVHAIAKTAAHNTFEFGRGLGILEGIITTLELPLIKINPKVWQKFCHFGVPPKESKKLMSLIAAKRIFPKENWLATAKSKIPHDGLIDAALLAHFGINLESKEK